jgi:opacity protein-like surface antigen
MLRSLLSSALLFAMTSAAAAETPSLSVSQGSSVLLPPIASATQPSLSRSESAGVASGQLNLSIGSHFKTELEGETISTHEATKLPTPGGVAATSLMLNGLYEISNGSWHLKPFVGGGFGFVDANAHLLGATQNDWQSAYQLHGGVQVGLAEQLMGSIEYRFTNGILPRGLTPTKFNLNSHEISLGFKYQY